MLTWDTFAAWERGSDDVISTRKVYVDLAGDLIAGMVLSEIVWWHLPSKQGKSKLVIKHDDHEWLARTHEEWWEACRISIKQVTRALNLLNALGLIETARYKFNGVPTTHIRLCKDAFMHALNTDLGLAPSPDLPTPEPAPGSPQRAEPDQPKGQIGIVPKGRSGSSQRADSYGSSQRADSITSLPYSTSLKESFPENSDEFPDSAPSLSLDTISPETITSDQLGQLTLGQLETWLADYLKTALDERVNALVNRVLEKEQAGKARRSLPDRMGRLQRAEWLRRNRSRFDRGEMLRLIANALDLPLSEPHTGKIGNLVDHQLWCYPDPYTPEEVAEMIAVKDAQPKDRDWRRYMTYGNFATNMGKYRSWKARKGHTPNGRSASAPQAGRPAGRPDYDALVEREQAELAAELGVPYIPL